MKNRLYKQYYNIIILLQQYYSSNIEKKKFSTYRNPIVNLSIYSMIKKTLKRHRIV